MLFEMTPARFLQGHAGSLSSPEGGGRAVLSPDVPPAPSTTPAADADARQQQRGAAHRFSPVQDSSEILFDSGSSALGPQQPAAAAPPQRLAQSSPKNMEHKNTFLDPQWQSPPTQNSAGTDRRADWVPQVLPAQPPVTMGDLGELYRQRDMLQQAMIGLRKAQEALAAREQKVKAREDAATVREQALQQLEESFRRQQEALKAAQAKAADSQSQTDAGSRAPLRPPLDSPAAHMLFEKEERLANTMQSVEDYRNQLRRAHKELNAREIDLDALKAALHKEKEALALRESALAARESIVFDEQDAVFSDVRRHAERIQASGKELERRARDISAREEAAEAQEYELQLRRIDIAKQEENLQRYAQELDHRSLEIHRCIDESMKLEYHAKVVEREMHRLHEREQELWSKAASCVPAAPAGLSAVSRSLFALRGELEAMQRSVPVEKALFHSSARR